MPVPNEKSSYRQHKMICPRCADNGTEVDMEHYDAEQAVADPGAYDGVSFRTGCGHHCNVCGFDTDCDDDHYNDPD